MKCRSCGEEAELFLDLGLTPNANGFRTAANANSPELFMPLRTHRCGACGLVQLQDFQNADYFFNNEYVYFSSWSEGWLRHAQTYARTMIAEGHARQGSLVVEIASNDGYLLRWFKDAGIDVLGVDPAGNCAEAAATNHGIDTVVAFFGRDIARDLVAKHRKADIMAANNVLAHVPDPNDFVGGFAEMLAPRGVATFEFPHLLNLIQHRQFDTIYHEHFSYLSLRAVESLLDRQGLQVTRVDTLPTHGGSLRVHARHRAAGVPEEPSVAAIRAAEERGGLNNAGTYTAFASTVADLKRKLLSLLIPLKASGKSIAAYGAPAKGNTLLVTCGIGKDMLDFTVDRSSWKQGMFLPGTGIPVLSPDVIAERKPDYVLILPWNLKDEIMGQMTHVRDWGGKFIVPIPEPVVIP
jgi:SAM-dependent methyltransferase